RANLVARLILAHILKIHSATFEDTVIIAGENGLDQSFGLDFEGADFLENFRGSFLQTVHRDLGNGKAGKNSFDDGFARDCFSLGLVANDDAMPQDIRSDAFYILRCDITAAVQKRVSPRAEREINRGPRPRAVTNQSIQMQIARRRLARRPDNID